MNDNDKFCNKCGSSNGTEIYPDPVTDNQKSTFSLTQAFIIFLLMTVIIVLGISLIRSKIETSGNDRNSPTAGSYHTTEPTEQINNDHTDYESDGDEKITTVSKMSETEPTITTTNTTTTTTAVTKKTTTTTTAALISVPFEPRNLANHPFRSMIVDINDPYMNWRIGPGYDYKKVDDVGIEKGAYVDIYAEEIDSNGETWGYIKRNEKWGWITEKYLKNAYAQDTVNYIPPQRYYNEDQPHFTVLVDGLRFRTGPSESAQVLCEFDSGTDLEEWGCNTDDGGKWIFTEYNGQFGWVMAYYGYGHEDPDFKYYIRYSGGMGKPVIYLYPTEKTDVQVELELLTSDLYVTYPNYCDGWNVTAYPDGRIVNKADGGTYDYLFWESVNSRTHYDMSKGFCVSADDTEDFLREKLEILGLNERERNEFIVYWLPIMKERW